MLLTNRAAVQYRTTKRGAYGAKGRVDELTHIYRTRTLKVLARLKEGPVLMESQMFVPCSSSHRDIHLTADGIARSRNLSSNR